MTELKKKPLFNTQHNYMFRMVHDTLVHFNNTTNELEPQLALLCAGMDDVESIIEK